MISIANLDFTSKLLVCYALFWFGSLRETCTYVAVIDIVKLLLPRLAFFRYRYAFTCCISRHAICYSDPRVCPHVLGLKKKNLTKRKKKKAKTITTTIFDINAEICAFANV